MNTDTPETTEEKLSRLTWENSEMEELLVRIANGRTFLGFHTKWRSEASNLLEEIMGVRASTIG